MTGEAADVADVVANMQVPLHIGRPHSPEFSRVSDAKKEVEFRVESP